MGIYSKVAGATTYDRIVSFMQLARERLLPTYKHLYFNGDDSFVVNGQMIKLIPFQYHKFYLRDEFYISVNVARREVAYYAYDNANGDDEEGYMEWHDMEDCIYNFFVLNIKDIVGADKPVAATPTPETRKPKPCPRPKRK